MEKIKPGPKAKVWTQEMIEEKIQSKVTPDGDCLIWTGAAGSGGYPMMRYKSKMRTVSSVIVEMRDGSVPNRESPKSITRTCGNIKCVALNHTVVRTKSEIMYAAEQTGTTLRFSTDEIRAIRKEYDDNPYRGAQRDLAIKWNCHPRHVWCIVSRRLYKWVK